MTIQTLHGDCRELLETLEAESVQTIVTSPPYWRMRRYTDDPREIGQENTPAAYVAALTDVFARCWRVLRNDGTLWLNLGDGYANDGKWGGSTGGKHAGGIHGALGPGRTKVTTGLPPKSLIGMPWRVAFALQDAGWILRTEIVWEKPNAMPESVTDRPTRSHEYVFLFAKSPRYFYDAAAISEPIKQSSIDRISQPNFANQTGGPKDTALRPIARCERR
jgi:DNA modification methylase